jgi:hypothetical protein
VRYVNLTESLVTGCSFENRYCLNFINDHEPVKNSEIVMAPCWMQISLFVAIVKGFSFESDDVL